LKPLRDLAPVSVSMFLFISGYGLTKSLRTKGIVYLQRFFQRRIFIIALPALLVTAIHLFLGGGAGTDILTRGRLILTRGETLLPHYWFVWTILFDYLAFWLSAKLLPEKYHKYAVLLLTVIFTAATYMAGFDRCWWVCSLAFATGMFFAEFESRVFMFCGKTEFHYWLVLLVLGLVFSACYLTRNPLIWTLCYVFIPSIGALLIARLPLDKFKIPILRFIGLISYELYLIHIPVMCFLRGDKVYLESPALYIAAVLALSLALAFGINRLKLLYLTKTT
jgi:peptidoglycan/LPS O-acetylase OafA/YrhL